VFGEPSFFPPVLLSAGNRWRLDGAKRLEAALQIQLRDLADWIRYKMHPSAFELGGDV